MPPTYEQFRDAFANAVNEDEAHQLYEQFAVPTLRIGEDRSIDTARTIEGGIGHDLLQEAPGAFAETILGAGR